MGHNRASSGSVVLQKFITYSSDASKRQHAVKCVAALFVVSFILLVLSVSRQTGYSDHAEGKAFRLQGYGFHMSKSRETGKTRGEVWTLPAEFAELFPAGLEADPQKLSLQIVVLASDDIESTARCVNSLAAADYDGDEVDLTIIVDHSFNPDRGLWYSLQHEKVRNSHRLLSSLEKLKWPHGQFDIHYRERKVGLQLQWLESWWPMSVNHFCLIADDDMEVSPLYYLYFKHAVMHYYYNSTNFNPLVFGMTLQTVNLVPGEGGEEFVWSNKPFLYQLVGPSGQLWFPAPWKRFRIFFDEHRFNASEVPDLGGMMTTALWKENQTKIFTPYFVKFTHANDLYNLRPSFPDNLALAVSHNGAGAAFLGAKGFAPRLAQRKDFMDSSLDWWVMPPMKQLKRFDFCFQVIPNREVVDNVKDLTDLLKDIQEDNNVALVFVPRGANVVLKNWLCHVDGLLSNYLLVLDDPNEARELAMRGHAVYLLSSWRTRNVTLKVGATRESLPWEPHWTTEEMILGLTVLQLGYNVLLSNVDTMWHTNPFRRFTNENKTDVGVLGVLDWQELSYSFLYLRNFTAPVWEGVIRDASSKAGRSWASVAKNALFTAFKSVKHKGVKIGVLREDTYIAPIFLPVEVGQRAATIGQKEQQLKDARLWKLDFDLACRDVTCKKKVPWLLQ